MLKLYLQGTHILIINNAIILFEYVNTKLVKQILRNNLVEFHSFHSISLSCLITKLLNGIDIAELKILDGIRCASNKDSVQLHGKRGKNRMRACRGSERSSKWKAASFNQQCAQARLVKRSPAIAK